MQSCPKPFTVAFIPAMAVAFLQFFSPVLQAGEAGPKPQAILGVDNFMKSVDRYQGM